MEEMEIDSKVLDVDGGGDEEMEKAEAETGK